MKKLCLSIMIIAVCLPLWGYTLKGGVTYTVETARKEAFANVEYTLPKSIIEANMFDPNFKENVKAIKLGIKETDDRYIGYFSDGGYEVVYKNDLYKEFYYTNKGKLDNIAIREKLEFPLKVYHYDITGKLIQVSLSLKKDDDYVFNSDGQLEAHWLNDTCYDKDGKVIGKRY